MRCGSNGTILDITSIDHITRALIDRDVLGLK
jgi:hypothetical protein